MKKFDIKKKEEIIIIYFKKVLSFSGRFFVSFHWSIILF